jgi:Putative peptidoglycan binding domain
MMKTFTSLLIACSLALAGAALAQPPEEQQSPSKKKRAAQKTQATEAQPGAKPQQRPAKQPGAMKEHGAMSQPGAANEPGARKGRKGRENQESANAPGTNVSGQPTGGAPNEPGAAKGRKGRAKSETEGQTGADVSGQPAGAAAPGAKQEAEQGRKGKQGRGAHTKTSATPAAAPGAAAGQQNAQANVAGGKKAKPDPQKVQQIKTQHASFRAQPKPQQVQPVTFNQNYRIQGSDQWQGAHYEVFRSYRPEWHDAGWYHSHYPNVTLIAGGYYFFNAGYWYPAWGYNPSAQYYAYDGPIFVGQRAQPPDQVIADVQAVLQDMGYYRGEVDGLLGPLTREALTAYQADNGLITTAAIDQPTLDSLGMG